MYLPQICCTHFITTIFYTHFVFIYILYMYMCVLCICMNIYRHFIYIFFLYPSSRCNLICGLSPLYSISISVLLTTRITIDKISNISLYIYLYLIRNTKMPIRIHIHIWRVTFLGIHIFNIYLDLYRYIGIPKELMSYRFCQNMKWIYS